MTIILLLMLCSLFDIVPVRGHRVYNDGATTTSCPRSVRGWSYFQGCESLRPMPAAGVALTRSTNITPTTRVPYPIQRPSTHSMFTTRVYSTGTNCLTGSSSITRVTYQTMPVVPHATSKIILPSVDPTPIPCTNNSSSTFEDVPSRTISTVTCTKSTLAHSYQPLTHSGWNVTCQSSTVQGTASSLHWYGTVPLSSSEVSPVLALTSVLLVGPLVNGPDEASGVVTTVTSQTSVTIFSSMTTITSDTHTPHQPPGVSSAAGSPIVSASTRPMSQGVLETVSPSVHTSFGQGARDQARPTDTGSEDSAVLHIVLSLFSCHSSRSDTMTNSDGVGSDSRTSLTDSKGQSDKPRASNHRHRLFQRGDKSDGW
jgi:hypothetical protein